MDRAGLQILDDQIHEPEQSGHPPLPHTVQNHVSSWEFMASVNLKCWRKVTAVFNLWG